MKQHMAKNRHPLKLLMHLMKTLFLSARGTPIFGIVHSRHGQMFITYLIEKTQRLKRLKFNLSTKNNELKF